VAKDRDEARKRAEWAKNSILVKSK
jgi:hypothetical protein